MTGKINQLLTPTKQKVVLFIIFMLIAVAGQIQSYAFTNDEEFGRPKPVLYEVLKPFPLWALLMYLLLPLFPIYFIFSSFGIGNIVFNAPLFLFYNLIYFYLLASFIGFCYEKYKQKFTAKFFGIWIGMAIAFNLASYGGAFILRMLGEPVLFSEGAVQGFITGLIMSVTVIVFYGYVISCAFFLIRERIKSL